jgi:hypothetical protein
MSVNCVYCGHVNPDGSTVCLSCGRTLPPAPSAGGSYGQQQPPQSWGSQPPAAPPPAPGSYPPANPYGGSYPPAQDPNAGWQGGYGGQPSSFGNQQQTPTAQPPSFGNQQQNFGGPSYPPPAPFGQAPVWGEQAFGATNPEAQSAKQMAIIALVVSALGVVIGWCCYIGLVLGPVGAILGFVARGKLVRNNAADGQGLALAAVIVGGIAFVIPILLFLLGLALNLGNLMR